MARVSRRSASVLARRSPSTITKRKARKHKVILESVTQEKKKLRSVISFEARAPPGYTFIPAGNPHFTTACKELCRQDGLKVFAVSTTPHMHTHNLSQHVHRIGYHFPSAVVATVCMDRGLYLTATGKAVPFYGFGNQTSRKRANSVSQITINTEARDVLKDLFPNIPDNDLNQIIKTAFQKGQRKVGTAVELPLARRAQLAVVAHIRHIYTNYDRLLKTTSFHEARAAVEEPTLAKVVEWRGDDENGRTVLEDVFREVIVISDDEDSDNEGESQPSHGRDSSVEIVSSNPRVEELQTRPVNYGNPALREARVEISEDEAPPGFRFVPEIPKKTKIDRRGFSRYQAWDRAINRYRNIAGSSNQQPPLYPPRLPLQENIGFDREQYPHRPLESRHVSTAPYTLPNPRPANSILSRHSLKPVAENREQYELYPVVDQPNKRAAPPLHNPPNLVPLDRGPVPRQGPLVQQSGSSINGPVFVTYPGDRYGTIGQPSVRHDSHIRRTHVAPVDPLYVTERQPRNAQDPSSMPTSCFDHGPQPFTHQGSIKDYEGHMVASHAHHRVSNQPRITADARYAIPIDIGHDRAVPAQQLDARESHFYQSLDGYNAGDARLPNISETRSEPTWRNRNPEGVLAYKPVEKPRLYADGFVRTVDLREPSVLEYPSARRPPASDAVDSSPHGGQRRVPSDRLAPLPPHARARVDSQAKITSLPYPVVEGRSPRHQDGRLFRSPPTTHQHERRYENAPSSSRQPYESYQRVPWTAGRRSPAYVRRVDDPRRPLPEGRTVVIMD